MKRQLWIPLVFALALTFAWGNGGQDKGEGKRPVLRLLQNKPEIDAPLKQYAEQWGGENGAEVVITTDADVDQLVTIGYASGDLPDIFVLSGLPMYEKWKDIILDVSDQPWTEKTDLAFTMDGKTYGFPVAIEGWGLAYNQDILEAAGIDPLGLTNLSAYRRAFALLDSKKKELGLNSVVSMTASYSMYWVCLHNFDSLLANGLPYGDLSVTNDLLNGIVDNERLSQYADWVQLLFDYSDQSILLAGDYDAQINEFATGQSAFLHQGNWADGKITEAGATFRRAFAPHGSMNEDTDGIFVSAAAYYAINAGSEVTDMANKFLNDMVFTDAGNDYMVNEAGMIPAFSNVTLTPSGPLSKSIQKWAAEGKVYSWDQSYFTTEFKSNALFPLYNQFASKSIDKELFVAGMKAAFESLKP